MQYAIEIGSNFQVSQSTCVETLYERQGGESW